MGQMRSRDRPLRRKYLPNRIYILHNSIDKIMHHFGHLPYTTSSLGVVVVVVGLNGCASKLS